MNLRQLCLEADGPILFDMDGTLFDGDLSESCHFLLLAAAQSKKDVCDVTIADLQLLSDTDELAHYTRLIREDLHSEAYLYSLEYLEGFFDSHIERTVRFSFEIAQEPIALNDTITLHADHRGGLIHLLRFCLEMQKRVIIISASPTHVVEAYCLYAGIKNVEIIAAEGSNPTLPNYEGKVQLLQNYGITKVTLAFGNSRGDLAMLKFAERGVLRNPMADSHLSALAHKHRLIEVVQ